MEDNVCKISKKCGGCSYQGIPYGEQLKIKHKKLVVLLGNFGKVENVIGMENPFYYRNKVHHSFSRDRSGNIVSGIYEANSHRIVPADCCLLEDRQCTEIILTVRKLLRSFRIQIYNEDSGTGLFRHVLVRKGFSTGEIMVVLVVSSQIFPSKSNFVRALLEKHPEITTVVLNVNSKKTSMVLGDKNFTAYGPGYITDILCGFRFRISPDSFYQVNPVQTEILYGTAISFAGLTGRETVIDAYCGTGTIGICASKNASETVGAELNPDAVKDAVANARGNNVKNIRFVTADAGEFMEALAKDKKKADVVFMDPPRTGSSEKFLRSLVTLSPSRIVYVSCGPESLARDLKYLTSKKYTVKKIQPVDMFPFTEHVEVVVQLSKE